MRTVFSLFIALTSSILIGAATVISGLTGIASADEVWKEYEYYHFTKTAPTTILGASNPSKIYVWSGQMSGLNQPMTYPRTLAWGLKFKPSQIANMQGIVNCVTKMSGITNTGAPLSYTDIHSELPDYQFHGSIANLRDFYTQYTLKHSCTWQQKVYAPDGTVTGTVDAFLDLQVEFRVGKNN